MQYFQLIRDTVGPQISSIDVLPYYKDNSKSITINSTDASFMKVWIDQKATGDVADAPSTWSAYSSSWQTQFVTEGTNYIHIIVMDEVGNIVQEDGHDKVYNSSAVIFDKTAPVISAVVIDDDKDITTERNVIVRVTASDAKSGVDTVSGILKVVLDGDIDTESDKTFTWSDSDREAGYKDCSVILKANSGTRETKTINVLAYDRAENESERKSDSIVLYTGGVDPVMVAKDGNTVIGAHYGKKKFDIKLEVLTGDASMLAGYKVWGDFGTTDGGTTPTPEPEDWQTWPSGETDVTVSNLYLTALDGQKTLSGAARFNVGTITETVSTKAELPSSATEGDIYKVTTDETQDNKATVYKFIGTAFVFIGILEEGDETHAYHNLENISIHHSEAEPIIVLSTDTNVISDKEDFNTATLTSEMTTTCNISEYKVVAYESQALAEAGTYVDASNVGLTGYTEIPSGESWEAELEENKLILAIPNEGAKFLVVYAKNLCDKWGKSNVVTVTVDLTAPTGSITVNNFYNAASGFTASATDAGAGMAKMTVWVDNTQGSEIPPTGATEYNYAANPTASQVFGWSELAEGDSYAHIKYVDAVGNFAIVTSSKFIYDVTAPTGVSIILPAYTNVPTVTGTISGTDSLSGIKEYKVYGDVSGAATAEAAEWKPFVETITIALTSGDGTKVVNLLLKDNAGNVTATAASAQTILDSQAPAATLVLFNNTNTEALGDKTNVVEFYAHIGVNDALDVENIAGYKLWGDFEGGSADEPTGDYIPFTPDTGKTYMSVAKALTSTDGLKTIKAVVVDKAGNKSAVASASVTIDTTKPVITISGVDYNIISDKHKARLTTSGSEIANTYCDTMTFKFSSDQKLSEYKVCVWDDEQVASSAIAIGMTGGSINMSGGSVDANDEVACTLLDADFSATDEVAGTDGTYFVIVYGKNEAGTWSAAKTEVSL